MKRRNHKQAARTAARLVIAATAPEQLVLPLPPPDPHARRHLPGVTRDPNGNFRARTTLITGGKGDLQVGVFLTEVEASNAAIWAKATFGDEKHQTWALRLMYERDALGLPYREPDPSVRLLIAKTLTGA